MPLLHWRTIRRSQARHADSVVHHPRLRSQPLSIETLCTFQISIKISRKVSIVNYRNKRGCTGVVEPYGRDEEVVHPELYAVKNCPTGIYVIIILWWTYWDKSCTVSGSRVVKKFCKMFSESSPCLLGQHGSCSTAQRPVELSENVLNNHFSQPDSAPQTVNAPRLCSDLTLTRCLKKRPCFFELIGHSYTAETPSL